MFSIIILSYYNKGQCNKEFEKNAILKIEEEKVMSRY